MLRAYFWKCHTDAEHGLAIIAKNGKRAKDLGYAEWASDVGVEPETFIEQRVNWIRKANIKGINKEGVINLLDGVRRGIYGYVEECECDKCGEDGTIYPHEGKALCNNCIEEDS